jgi:hypothetical protein
LQASFGNFWAVFLAWSWVIFGVFSSFLGLRNSGAGLSRLWWLFSLHFGQILVVSPSLPWAIFSADQTWAILSRFYVP